MVTLSCLIVIASLFSQTTSSMPTTASPKIIDIYFMLYIQNLFYLCIHHTILYWLKLREQKFQDEQRSHGDRNFIDHMLQLIATFHDFVARIGRKFNKRTITTQTINDAYQSETDHSSNNSSEGEEFLIVIKYDAFFSVFIRYFGIMKLVSLIIFTVYQRQLVHWKYDYLC